MEKMSFSCLTKILFYLIASSSLLVGWSVDTPAIVTNLALTEEKNGEKQAVAELCQTLVKLEFS